MSELSVDGDYEPLSLSESLPPVQLARTGWLVTLALCWSVVGGVLGSVLAVVAMVFLQWAL